jgi:carboxypeptidase Q
MPQQLLQWGLVNARFDEWGDFGKGWELKKSYVAMNAPYYRPINAFPKSWCSGTNGLQNADVVLITSKDSAGLDEYRGKLTGKIRIVDRDFT